MAARFWRWLLASELAVAAAIAWAVAALLSLSTVTTTVLALAVFLLLQILLATTSMVLGALLTDDDRGASRSSWLLRACLTEGPLFGLKKLAMSIEPWLAWPETSAPPGAEGSRPLLLIHGMLCNRAVWRGLYPRLRAAGFAPVRAINLTPLYGDIDGYAGQFTRALCALSSEACGARVAVIAHSMGGLVARAALRMDTADAISQLVTIGTPHHGSVLARFAPGAAARQMRPGSRWLQQLNAAQEGRLPVPVTSIYSADDNLVAPVRSAVLQNAEHHAVRGVGHFGLLCSREVLDCVLATLTREAR